MGKKDYGSVVAAEEPVVTEETSGEADKQEHEHKKDKKDKKEKKEKKEKKDKEEE